MIENGPELWARLDELYHAVLEQPEEERDAFLCAACGGDEELRREILSLLRFDGLAGFFDKSPVEIAARLEEAIQDAPLDAPSDEPQSGQIISRYQLLSLLGEGGMGKVYRAKDTLLDREVAIKIMLQHLAGRDEALARFKVEAKAVAALSHPNILAIYDFGTEDGVTFAVMELLAGETLRGHLARTTLDWPKAVEYGLALAEGLAAAHTKGIVHGDLKPENIFLTQDGQLKILDFGLARMKRDAFAQDTGPLASKDIVTRPGVVMGTVGYMSPEQLRGEVAEASGDIFSFGCVLYEMVAGHRAFPRAAMHDTITAILRDDPPPLTESGQVVPPALTQLIMRCLEKKPENRCPSASELVADLNKIREIGETRSLPVPVDGRFRRAVWMGGISLLLLGSLAAALMWRGSKPEFWLPQALSMLPGNEEFPALSPDGAQLAFSWSGSEKEGPGDIYIKAVGSEDLRRLTNTSANETVPAWSPDGMRLAFLRTGQGVFVISQAGGPERKVSDTGSWVRWTPNNSIVIRDSIGGGAFGVFEISLDTLERRQIQLGQSRNVTRFDISPDGETLAFIDAARDGVNDVYVVSMAGGEAKRRTNVNAPVGAVIWTPDGQELIMNFGYGYPTALFRFPAFGSGPASGVLIPTSLIANAPTISRPASGRPARLAYLTLQGDISLRLIDLTAPRPSGLIQAVQPLLDQVSIDYPGSFSQDGSRIAFMSFRAGESPPGRRLSNLAPDQLWVAGRDGSGLRQLTKLDAPEIGSPSWSPDGKWIVFDSPIDGNTDIHIISADGGEPRRLTTEPSVDRWPSWSHDGSTIYFSSNRTGSPQIWKVPVAGGSASQVTRDGGVEPIESMDGTSIYYLHFRTQSLRKVPVGGGEETVVINGVRLSQWAVTENGVFFITPDGPADALDLYNPSDGKVTRFGRLPFQISRIISRFTVSRDGRWGLTLQTDRWAKDVLLVDNFR